MDCLLWKQKRPTVFNQTTGIRGKEFVVTVTPGSLPPLVFGCPRNGVPTRSECQISGIGPILIEYLGYSLGFKPKFVTPSDGSYGDCQNWTAPNTTCTGMTGMLYRVDADFAARFYDPYPESFQIIDFSANLPPKLGRQWSFLFRTPGPDHSATTLLRPFTPTIWLSILLTICIVLVTVIATYILLNPDDSNVIHRGKGESSGWIANIIIGWSHRLENVGKDFWSVTEIGLQQGTNNLGEEKESGPHRDNNRAKMNKRSITILFLIWIIGSFILSQIYSASLYPLFINPKIRLPFTDCASLADLVLAGKVEWIVPGFWIPYNVMPVIRNRVLGANRADVKPSRLKLARALADVRVIGGRTYKDVRQLLLDPQTDKIRFFYHETIVADYVRNRECGLTLPKDPDETENFRIIGFRKGFPYQNAFNTIISSWTEATVKDIIANSLPVEREKPTTCEIEIKAQKLSLIQLNGVFYAVTIGLLIAMAFFGWEQLKKFLGKSCKESPVLALSLAAIIGQPPVTKTPTTNDRNKDSNIIYGGRLQK